MHKLNNIGKIVSFVGFELYSESVDPQLKTFNLLTFENQKKSCDTYQCEVQITFSTTFEFFFDNILQIFNKKTENL